MRKIFNAMLDFFTKPDSSEECSAFAEDPTLVASIKAAHAEMNRQPKPVAQKNIKFVRPDVSPGSSGLLRS